MRIADDVDRQLLDHAGCQFVCWPAVPVDHAMLLGFIFAKSPTSMQGRITVTLTVPAQVLSMFCSAVAGTLLPVFGFHGAVLVFLAVLVASAVLVICSRSIRSIPKAAQWEHTMLR